MKSLNFRRAIFQDMELVNLNLEGADFYRARLNGISLKNVGLKGAILDSADLKDARLTAVVLKDAQIVGTRFQRANLEAVNFQGSLLKNAEFTGSTIIGSSFAGVDPTDLASCVGLDLKTILETADSGGEEIDTSPVSPSLGRLHEAPRILRDARGGTAASRSAGTAVAPARQDLEKTVCLSTAPVRVFTISFECPHLEARDLTTLLQVLDSLHDQVARSAYGVHEPGEMPAGDRLRVVGLRVDPKVEISVQSLVILGATSRDEGKPVLEIVAQLFGSGLLERSERLQKAILETREDGRTPVSLDELGLQNPSLAREEHDIRSELSLRARSLLPGVAERGLERIVEAASRLPRELFGRQNLTKFMIS